MTLPTTSRVSSLRGLCEPRGFVSGVGQIVAWVAWIYKILALVNKFLIKTLSDVYIKTYVLRHKNSTIFHTVDHSYTKIKKQRGL